MNLTKREILGISLLVLLSLCSFGAWQTFFTAMINLQTATFWWCVGWFVLLAILFFLGEIVWKKLLLKIIGAGFIFLPAFLFTQAWEFIIFCGVAFGLLYWSDTSVAEECEERTRFHFFKNVRAGSFLFVLSLSLLLSTGYYVSLKNVSWEEMVPRFQVGEQMTGVIFKIAGLANPSFAQLSNGGMTVDEFLLNLEKNQQGDASTSQPSEQDLLKAYPGMQGLLNGGKLPLSLGVKSPKTADELFLDGGRAQIASLVGRPVAGNEKISDILSVAVQNKLVTFLRGEKATGHMPSQAIPFFLALLLFLTLLSLLSLVAPVCILAAQCLFWLAQAFGWLTISRIQVEQEKLLD